MPLTLKCKEQGCGQDFVVEDGEIAFLQGKFGADYKPPQRCKPCRDAKKQRMDGKSSQPPASPSQNNTYRDDNGNSGGEDQPRKKGKKNRSRRGDGYSDY